MEKITLPQLENFLWKSADILRGKIDSSDYKKYIFGLLFYKRINDVWHEEHLEFVEKYQGTGAEEEPFHRFQLPNECRWKYIQNTSEGIGKQLDKIFDKITHANSPKLDKIFDDLNFADTDRFPNDVTQKLINHFSQFNFGNSYISSDLLGDSYEYLIKQFAADAGKKGGEFYTPREVEKVIIQILKPHEKDHIYDPTCGSGGFLLEAYNYVKEKFGQKATRKLYLYGQEMNIGTYAIAKINMFLHGLDGADIRREDTLKEPLFKDNLGNLKTFDVVVANFPYSIKEWAFEMFEADKYGRKDGFDTPPRKNADYAFILHIIASLNQNGKAGIVAPHGVLFRGGAEGRIRKQLIEKDLIEAVIGLPEKLFYGTKISAVVFILNKNKPVSRKGKIIFINAEKGFVTEKKQNLLRELDIKTICAAVDSYTDIPRYAKVVKIEEIASNDYFLNIDRYVDTSEIEETIDIESLDKNTSIIEKEIFQLQGKIKFLTQKLKSRGIWKEVPLREILFEHKELSSGKEEVHSVSVKKGIVNQVEHLGRSYSATDTSNYKLVKPGDVVYTKSPTGDFPYGIIKQSKLKINAIVSPLYGVFTPINKYMGMILDAYFESKVNTNNYLKPIVSKGAKNTINISNTVFLSRSIYLPQEIEEQKSLAEIIELINEESRLYEVLAANHFQRKKALVRNLLSRN